jgi:hypothetical protein
MLEWRENFEVDQGMFVFAFQKRFWKKLNFILFFILFQINMFLVFSNYFDVLMLKIIFKK